MKKLLFILAITFSLHSDYYMAQIVPYQTHSVEAELSGIVHRTALKKEFSYINRRILVIKIDTTIEDIGISSLKDKVASIKESLSLKRENLKSKSRIRQISKYDLNKETLSVVDTKIMLISTEMDLKLKKYNRERKLFYLSKAYLGEIYVDEFEYVNAGEKLFEYYDFSKSRLDIFVSADDVQNILEKTVFINDKKSDSWKIEKISKTVDSKRVSTFKVRLTLNNRNPENAIFGKVLKVEFK